MSFIDDPARKLDINSEIDKILKKLICQILKIDFKIT